MPLAYDYATKALRLDTGLADAHAVLGAIRLTWQWDWTGAEANLRTALELNPGNYIAAQQYAYYLIATGEQEKAISVMNRALELDPLNVRLMSGLGYIYCLSRRFTEGIEQAQTTLELHPEDPMANWVLTVNLFGAGRYEEASETIAGLFEVFPPLRRNGLFLAGLVASQARGGNALQAMENLRELEELSQTQHVPPSSMAVTYLCLDDHDRAFDFLEKAIENHDTQLFHLVVSYLVDPVREDPRFKVILSRMNFPGT